MSRMPITRIPTFEGQQRDPNRDAVREYIQKAFAEYLAHQESSVLFDVSVYPGVAVYEAKVFMTDRDLLPSAQLFAFDLQGELRSQGLPTAIALHSWTAAASGAGR